MTHDTKKMMRETLEKLTYRQDLRNTAKEIHEEDGRRRADEMVAKTVAHWAEQVLQEHYGSRTYGYTVTKSRHKDNIILTSDEWRNPVKLKSAIGYDFVSEIGIGVRENSGNLRNYKTNAADWMEDQIVEIAAETLDHIQHHEAQVAQEGGMI